MIECNTHHPRSSVENLHLPYTKADYGFNIDNLFYCTLVLMTNHPFSSTDYLVKLCSNLDMSLPLCVAILSRAKNYCSALSIDVNIKICPTSILKCTICEKQLSLLIDSLTVKLLHGKYYSLLDSCDVDKSASIKWLRQHLHSESEFTVLVIQD